MRAMSQPTFSKETLSKVFDVLKDRLQISGDITTAPACQRICERLLISHSSAQAIFRFIMFQLVMIGKAKYVKRGKWKILKDWSIDSIPELGKGRRRTIYREVETVKPPPPSQADLAAMRLREIGFTEKNALDVAEEYGVTVRSLLLAYNKPIARQPEEKKEIKRQSNAYQFKTDYDD